MCRIALLYNAPDGLAAGLADRQANGANRPPTFWRSGRLILVHSRFDVTTSGFADGTFPLTDGRYVVHYNGEVYGHGGSAFCDEPSYPSDVHYCLALIRQHGIEGFLSDADLQGTFHIHDLQTQQTFVIADQLNTAGCFYSVWRDTTIVAQEFPLIDWALGQLGAPPDVPIKILENGTYLRFEPDGSFKKVSYRPDWRQVFEGEEFSIAAFERTVEAISSALLDSTIRRVPRTGPVGVLASGGVDSSTILAILADHLRRHGEMDRLKVFTFGRPDIGTSAEENDLLKTIQLLDALRIEPQRHLVILGEHLDREALFRTKVFCDSPRLITPNPILNTQVRHTVRMSLVLADIANRYPEVKVVLTGDVADELFAGYHSMRVGVNSPAELAQRVRDKLSDLPLNDSARYTLASLHGCSEVIKISAVKALLPHAKRGDIDSLTAEEIWRSACDEGYATPELEGVLASLHPIEVRTPFSSHRILRALRQAHPDFLVGEFGGQIMSKFLLRVVSEKLGVPKDVAARKKIPFNEGGSGIRNSDRDGMESSLSRCWHRYTEEDLTSLARSDSGALVQLGILANDQEVTAEVIRTRYEQIAVYAAAKLCGLERLLRGGVFRAEMPDCVYSTEETQAAYQPDRFLRYCPDVGLQVVGRELMSA